MNAYNGKGANVTFSITLEAQNAFQNVIMIFGSLPIIAEQFSNKTEPIKPVSVKCKIHRKRINQIKNQI